MDASLNPFEPGAGRRPPELAGRQDILEEARIACSRISNGRSARSIVLWGLRGTGKTVLLNAIKKNAEALNLIVSKVEAPEGENLAQLLCPEMRKILLSLSLKEKTKDLAKIGLSALRNFASIFKLKFPSVEIEISPSPGLADSGDLEYDLPELFRLIGKVAAAEGRAWLLLIDELQYLKNSELSALAVALHSASQEGLPILVIGAGLPQTLGLLGSAKSYSERLFACHQVENLSEESSKDAIRIPLEKEQVGITDAALEQIVQKTHGYPFFIQLWAYKAWNEAQTSCITVQDVERSYESTIRELDDSFFRVRMDRLTNMEKKFVCAMSVLDDAPYQISDIAKQMNKTVASISPHRAKLISKGMIYSTSHGKLDFSVPLFAEYLHRRNAKVHTDN